MGTIGRQQWLKFFSHLLVICMLFFLPELMMSYTRDHPMNRWDWLMYIKSAIYVAVFYLNYYIIVRRTLLGDRRRFVRFALWNLAVIVLAMLVLYLLQRSDWFMEDNRRMQRLSEKAQMIRQWSMLIRDLGMILLTIALSVALRLGESWREMEKRHREVLAAQREEELVSLRSQLNPHFLFNTLNTIYSLVDIDPRQAKEAVHRLSKMLRYVLYENPESVPVESELDFLRNYMTLMELRLGPDAVKAEFSVSTGTHSSVAPLLFVPLVENAFKHGNTGRQGEPIEISVKVAPDGTVVCRTFNHFLAEREKTEGGIGISNLRRRLQLIYGDRASLDIRKGQDTYEAVMTIKPALV